MLTYGCVHLVFALVGGLSECKIDAIWALLIFSPHRMFKCICERELGLCDVHVSDTCCCELVFYISLLKLPPSRARGELQVT